MEDRSGIRLINTVAVGGSVDLTPPTGIKDTMQDFRTSGLDLLWIIGRDRATNIMPWILVKENYPTRVYMLKRHGRGLLHEMNNK
jgi:hypothetical protein